METMTPERLDQYLSLKKELRELEEQYRELCRRGDHVVSDSVSGSMPEYPYIKRVVKIQGLDVADQERRDRMRARLNEQRVKGEQEVESINEWICTILDSRLRRIVTLRFVYGLEWAQVAHKMGGNETGDGVRMAFSRFIKKS